MLSSPVAASSAPSHASASSTLPPHVTAPLTPGSLARSSRPTRHRNQSSVDAAPSRYTEMLPAAESSTAAARSAIDEQLSTAAAHGATDTRPDGPRSSGSLWQVGWQLTPPPQPQPQRQPSRSISPHQAERARQLSSGIQAGMAESPPPPRPLNPPPTHLLQRVAAQHHQHPASPTADSPRSRYTYASTAHSSLHSPLSPPLTDLLHAFPAGPGSAFEKPRPAPSPPAREPAEPRLAPALPVRERVPAAGVGQSPTRPNAQSSSAPLRAVPRKQPPTLSSVWSATPPRVTNPPQSAPPVRGLRRLFLPDEAASAGRTARRLRLRLSADLTPPPRPAVPKHGTPSRAAASSPLRASQAPPSSKSPAVKLALARARALSGARAEHKTADGPTLAATERHIPPSTPPRRAPPTNVSPGSNLNFSRPLPPLPDPSTPPSALPHAHRGFLASLEQRKARERKDRLHAWSIEVSSGGVPSVAAHPSAFHAAGCPVAQFGAATWQCGCQGSWTGRKGSCSPPPSLSLRPRASAPELRNELSAQAKTLQEHGVLIETLAQEVAGLAAVVRHKLGCGREVGRSAEALLQPETDQAQESIESVAAEDVAHGERYAGWPVLGHNPERHEPRLDLHNARHDLHDLPRSCSPGHQRMRSDASTSSPSSHGTVLSPERTIHGRWRHARTDTHESASTLATSLGDDSPSRLQRVCCGSHALKGHWCERSGSARRIASPPQPHVPAATGSQASLWSTSTTRPRTTWTVDSRALDAEHAWPPPPLLPPRGSSLGLAAHRSDAR